MRRVIEMRHMKALHVSVLVMLLGVSFIWLYGVLGYITPRNIRLSTSSNPTMRKISSINTHMVGVENGDLDTQYGAYIKGIAPKDFDGVGPIEGGGLSYPSKCEAELLLFDASNENLGGSRAQIYASNTRSGGWVINSPTTIADQTMYIDENVTINSTLKIVNSTIYFNSTDFCWMNVTRYGRLEIVDSKIFNLTGSYTMVVKKGGHFFMNNSVIRSAYDPTGKYGILVESDNVTILNSNISLSDKAKNGTLRFVGCKNITIQNVTFYMNYAGAWFVQCSNVSIINSTFRDNIIRGLRIDNSSNILIDNVIIENSGAYGLNIYNDYNVTVRNVSLYRDQIWIQGTQEQLKSLQIIDSTKEDKPIVYYFNSSDVYIGYTSEYGQLIFAYCRNISLRHIMNTALTFYNVSNLEIVDSEGIFCDSAVALWYVDGAILRSLYIHDNDNAARIGWASNITFKNCFIYDNTYFGIVAYFVQDVEIISNTFTNNYWVEFACMAGQNLKVINNTFTVFRLGVGLWTWRGNISDCLIANNTVGLYDTTYTYTWGIDFTLDYYYIWNVTVLNNTVRSMNQGIDVWSYGLASNITIENNTVEGCSYFAIGINYDAPNSTIRGNRVRFSDYGIYLRSSTNIIVERNIVENNTYGIRLRGSSEILVFSNCIIYNEYQAYDDGANDWNTTTQGNFWSDYTGEDTNNDEIGDTPYIIDGDSIDYLPLIFCKLLPDNEPPIIEISKPANNTITNNTNILLNCSVIEKYLKEVEIYLNESLMVKTREKIIVQDLTLDSDGLWVIKILARDFKNNMNVETLTVIVDTTKPTLIIKSPSNGTIVGAEFIVKWEGNDNIGIDHYEYRIDNGPWTSVGLSNQTSLIISISGWYTIWIKAVDIAGNYEIKSIVVGVDLARPEISEVSPSNGSIVAGPEVTLTWAGEDDLCVSYYMIRIDDGPWRDIGNITSYTVMFDTPGNHTIYIRAYDIAGRNTAVSIVLIVDLLPPKVNILSPANNTTTTNMSITIIWNATDDIGVDHFEIGVNASQWINLGMTYRYVLNISEPGTYIICIKAVDCAGRETIIALVINVVRPTTTITFLPIPPVLYLGIAIIIMAVVAMLLAKRRRECFQPTKLM